METKGVPLRIIRGLLVKQCGRCAITGVPLDPAEVNGDHIIPLSRRELDPSFGADNIWIVDKRSNAMKGAMTYDELVEMARLILNHEAQSRELKKAIENGTIRSVEKSEFDNWVSENCDVDGKVLEG